MSKGLTFTVVFKAMSMNYGESLGNISELKKLNSGDSTFTYMSRQAIRYELYKSLTQNFGMDKGKASALGIDQKVVQFKSETTITDYAEADLFGYMKTKKKKAKGEKDDNENGKGSVIRPAVVRITPAIALEPFLNDIEFGTNKSFADRTGKDPDPFQFEHQLALYSYTITIDLDRIGTDENDNKAKVANPEKYKRVEMVLNAVQLLNREIKGRIENLNPLFAIGGVYSIKNPFFLGRIKTKFNKDKKAYEIQTNILEDVSKLEYSLNGTPEKVSDNTYLGLISGYWANEDELKKLTAQKDFSMNSFFSGLKDEVKKYYPHEAAKN